MRILLFVLIVNIASIAASIEESKADPQEVKVRHYSSKMGIKAIYRLPQDRKIWTQRIAVLDSLVIPAGDSLVVQSPTTVLFERAGKLVVEGTLIARGTFEYPVVFTGMPYSQSYEYVFDETRKDTLWAGIVLRGNGKLVLDTTVISNATFGLSWANERPNIEANCLILNGTIRGIPALFQHNEKKDTECIDYRQLVDGRTQPMPGVEQTKTVSHSKFAKRSSLFSTGICVAGLTGIFVFEQLRKQAEADATVESDRAKAYELRNQRDIFLTARNISIGSAAAGFLGAVTLGIVWVKGF